tara:strand:+ start:547 stop:1266 length:720 start_codon:yes stop_codon:yes gene_type:complete
MQRRRKPKNEPKNIFSKGGQHSPKSSRPVKKEPNVAKNTPKTRPKPTPPLAKEKPPKEGNNDLKTSSEENNNAIIEDQILGTPKKKTRGLKNQAKEQVKEVPKTSTRAQQIIDASKARAAAITHVKKVEKKVAEAPKPVVQKPTRRRRTNNSYQPANPERRLDRSRHMEYKYEMKRLLVEIDVSEEHRSALLGTIWAKGERQTSQLAREYIREKQKDGMIDEDQVKKLISVVDSYTIRR